MPAGSGRSPGRKRILEHFPAKKRIWSLVAAILSLNGAKNNPKIVTKITAVRPKGALAQAPPPKYATDIELFGSSARDRYARRRIFNVIL